MTDFGSFSLSIQQVPTTEDDRETFGDAELKEQMDFEVTLPDGTVRQRRFVQMLNGEIGSVRRSPWHRAAKSLELIADYAKRRGGG